MGGDTAAGFQDVAGDGELVSGGADVAQGVVQDEILEMDELSVDPKRGMRLKEMRAFEKARADERAGDALVEAGKCDGCGFYFAISIREMSYLR